MTQQPLTTSELHWEVQRLVGLGIVDTERVRDLLGEGYRLAERAARDNRDDDYCKLMRILHTFAKLELSARPQEVRHEHRHAHAHAHAAIEPDARRRRLAAITAGLGLNSVPAITSVGGH